MVYVQLEKCACRDQIYWIMVANLCCNAKIEFSCSLSVVINIGWDQRGLGLLVILNLIIYFHFIPYMIFLVKFTERTDRKVSYDMNVSATSIPTPQFSHKIFQIWSNRIGHCFAPILIDLNLLWIIYLTLKPRALYLYHHFLNKPESPLCTAALIWTSIGPKLFPGKPWLV